MEHIVHESKHTYRTEKKGEIVEGKNKKKKQERLNNSIYDNLYIYQVCKGLLIGLSYK